VILVDHPFDARPENARLMEQVADMAEMLLVPAICWIGPGFFHLQSWADFDRLAFLPHHLERSEYAKWRTLMQKPASKWVGLTCNRFLLRQPYRAEVSSPDNGHGFDEREGLWASPVYAFAALLEASMGLYGWPTHVSDWKRVRLEGMDSAETSFGHLPTETTFTDDRLYQLSRIGVAPIMGDQDNDLLFTPLDVTLGGEALSSQLFLSLLSREVIQSKEDYEGLPEPDSVRSHLESHFAKVWQVNGGVRPEAFEVQVQETASGCRSRISVKPSWSMLPSGKDLSLSLDWSSA
jgi:type VI secretion system protein ImpC